MPGYVLERSIAHGGIAVRRYEDDWQVRTDDWDAYATDSINLTTESRTRPSLSTLTTIEFTE